jgi:hypothetical protein
VFNLSPHTKTCWGTVLKNKTAQVSGLQKGQSAATRRTRARSKVTALPRLLRVDGAGALAGLSAGWLKTQPLSLRGWALPPVITTTAPDASRVAVLETLRCLIPIGRHPRIMVFPSLPSEYEVLCSAEWFVGSKLFDIHATDFVMPLHGYGYVMVDDCEGGRARAEQCAPVPDVLRTDLLPSKYAVVFSTSGVVLTSHHDTCGGLLVLAKGSSAIC